MTTTPHLIRGPEDTETPEAATGPTCSTCPHFAAADKQCRRTSPSAFPMPQSHGRIGALGIWPPVHKDLWCGEHPERKDPACGRLAAELRASIGDA